MANTLTSRKTGALPLLIAGEKLFGSHGIEGVSIRQINFAAGMSNNSAVTYHFGDKLGFVTAICKWRMPQLLEAARAEYEKVVAEGHLNDVAKLIGALLRPYLAIKDEDGRHPHAAFINQLLRSPVGRAVSRSLFDDSDPTLHILQRLEELHPHVPEALLHYRLRIMGTAFFDAVIEWDRNEDDPEDPRFTLDELIHEIEKMAAAACSWDQIAIKAQYYGNL